MASLYAPKRKTEPTERKRQLKCDNKGKAKKYCARDVNFRSYVLLANSPDEGNTQNGKHVVFPFLPFSLSLSVAFFAKLSANIRSHVCVCALEYLCVRAKRRQLVLLCFVAELR